MGGLHRAVPKPAPTAARSGPGTGVPGRDTVGSHVRDQVLRWSVQLAGHRPRVVFADGDDPRVVAAAGWLAENTSVRPTLLTGGPDAEGAENGVDRWSMARLAGDPEVRDALRLRANGVRRDPDEADRLAEDPVYVSAALVACGCADAAVAGATRPTGDVIRAGISVIGLSPGVSTISSSFVLVLQDGRRLAYGDCAVLPAPDEEQLAQVAVATARTFRELVDEDPVVAMLSFSTMGSAEHPEVDTVRAATGLARALEPDLCIDGELQFDAALLESVGSSKAAGSPVAGRANVLVFPNLSAGNIGYKITERLAGAAAIGPVLQGLAAPMNDLSRGCSDRDAIAVALLSAVQAVHADRAAGLRVAQPATTG
jgi:phosphotransacetylase